MRIEGYNPLLHWGLFGLEVVEQHSSLCIHRPVLVHTAIADAAVTMDTVGIAGGNHLFTILIYLLS